MLCAQMTHYTPLSTLELYDSDPVIDLDGLLSLVDFWLLLVASTSIFVSIGAVQPLPYSLPIQDQHHCTHARVTKQLFAGLAQG